MAKVATTREPAVAYFRTSSAANVGEDRDSLRRQQAVVAAFANRHQYQVVSEFYDAAISGAEAIEERPGFAAHTRTPGATGKFANAGGGGTYKLEELTDTLLGGKYKGTIELP